MFYRILRILVAATGLLPGIPGYSAGQTDPQIVAAQTVMHEEELYPGKITGVLDAETESAIRRYQIVHGFRVTGRLDSRTRSAMKLPAPAAPESVVEEDRQFLHRLAPPRPPAVAEVSPAPKQESHPLKVPPPLPPSESEARTTPKPKAPSSEAATEHKPHKKERKAQYKRHAIGSGQGRF